MTPICAKCQVEFRVQTNGVVLVSMAIWGPHEIRRADLWKCPICGVEILSGFSRDAELIAINPAFDSRLTSYELDPKETVHRYWLNPTEKTKAIRLAEDRRESVAGIEPGKL